MHNHKRIKFLKQTTIVLTFNTFLSLNFRIVQVCKFLDSHFHLKVFTPVLSTNPSPEALFTASSGTLRYTNIYRGRWVMEMRSEVETGAPEEQVEASQIEYVSYGGEHHLPLIMRLVDQELSEPYSIFTYRYFVYLWPQLSFLVLLLYLSWFHCIPASFIFSVAEGVGVPACFASSRVLQACN